MVIEQLDRALESISDQDVGLARTVIAEDDRIDLRYLEIHQGVLSLLARQAPVAGDLRIVAALLHMVRCIERMGDQCVNIAKLVELSGHEAPKDREILDTIERMGELARSEVSQSRDAFATRDVVLSSGPRSPGWGNQPVEPRGHQSRGRRRQRARASRVGDVHDPGCALPRAHSGQYRRHRRADGVRRNRTVPRDRERTATHLSNPRHADYDSACSMTRIQLEH